MGGGKEGRNLPEGGRAGHVTVPGRDRAAGRARGLGSEHGAVLLRSVRAGVGGPRGCGLDVRVVRRGARWGMCVVARSASRWRRRGEDGSGAGFCLEEGTSLSEKDWVFLFYFYFFILTHSRGEEGVCIIASR